MPTEMSLLEAILSINTVDLELLSVRVLFH